MEYKDYNYYESVTDKVVKESAVEVKKGKQKKSIIRELYVGKQKTISELSEKLHISIPSLASMVEELLEEKWLFGQEDNNGKQGRRPNVYTINTSLKHILILNITTHDTKIFILNINNEIVYSKQYELQLTSDTSFLDQLLKIIEDTIVLQNSLGKQIMMLGITLPGLVNKKTGFNNTYKNLNINDNSLSKIIWDNFKLNVFILNDSKATAYGEAKFGVGQNLSHILTVNVDWGVGLGIVLNGQIFNGASGFAGELGHIQVNPEGELCYCGKVGCLDTVTSASFLLKEIKNGLKNGQISILSKYKDNLEEINLEMVIDSAKDGDGFSIDILYKIGLELGKGLSVAVHLFNPQIIIIAGVLSKAGKLIVNPIEFAINKYCLPDFKKALMVEVSNLGENAKILGANAFVVGRLLK